MINFELNQVTGRRLPKKFWQNIFKKIQTTLKIKNSGMISLAVVGSAAMKQLNRIYRGKDLVTDVLSFAERDGAGKKNNRSAKTYWGEIVICYPQAVKQAKANGRTIEGELTELLVHGVLHLLGYDHHRPKEAKRMAHLTAKILN